MRIVTCTPNTGTNRKSVPTAIGVISYLGTRGQQVDQARQVLEMILTFFSNQDLFPVWEMEFEILMQWSTEVK